MSYDVTVYPSKLSGTITAPPSKSLLHRAIIAAALARGKTTIINATQSDDIDATLNAVKHLGATLSKDTTTLMIEGNPVKIPDKPTLNVGESGSTLRFLIPLFSHFHTQTTFKMGDTLKTRPIDTYKTLYKDLLTLSDNVLTLRGALKPGIFTIDTQTSSQFITGLLFLLPLFPTDSEIHIKKIPSEAYIDVTIDLLSHFGITVTKTKQGYYIKGNQTYQPTSIIIEGDYSNAAPFLCAGLFHKNIAVKGLNINSKQADKVILAHIKAMHGSITINENTISTRKSILSHIKIDIDPSPDIAPILALTLSFARLKSVLKNTKRLSYKESNRIETTLKTLNAIGASIEDKKNSLHITPIKNLIGKKTLPSFNDHRIVMLLAIAATFSLQPITIKDAQAINKSYPAFFEDLTTLGAKIKYHKKERFLWKR